MKDVLKILEQDGRTPPEDIAAMTGRPVDEVREIIAQAERDRLLLGVHAHVNWERAGEERCWALIGVKATPQRDVGFDAIAAHISRFPEAHSVWQVTGEFDLAVMVVARTMQEVSDFVSRRLLALEGVQGTNSHFVMHRFKDQGTTLEADTGPQRLAVAP